MSAETGWYLLGVIVFSVLGAIILYLIWQDVKDQWHK